MDARGPGPRFGFALIELLVVVAIVALLSAILLPALGEARRVGRMSVCESNLRQFGTATGTYALDFRDTIWSFSWSRQNCPSEFPDLVSAFSNIEGTSNQAVDIIRRLSAAEPSFPRTGMWIPSVDCSHLVILDYLARRLPEPMCACPEDADLKMWQQDIPGFDAGAFGVNQPDPIGVFRAKPYSSSYEVCPAAYDANATVTTRIHQADTQYTYLVYVQSRIGGLNLSGVTFPSQKAHMYDTHQRHYGRPMYFAVTRARQPVLHFDASVVVRRTRDTNKGWDPWAPDQSTWTTFYYQPYRYEPPTSTGDVRESVAGYYRWTRGGLGGVDFGGTEVNTGQIAGP